MIFGLTYVPPRVHGMVHSLFVHRVEQAGVQKMVIKPSKNICRVL